MMANLRGSVEPVYKYDLLAVFGGKMLQYRNEFPKPKVGDFLSVQRLHPFQMQVLETEDVVFTDQLQCELPEKIRSFRRNMPMLTRKGESCAAAIGRAVLFLTEPAA